MIEFPFEKCKKCANPVRLVDIHGKTIGRKCYYQLDTMKEWWDEDDCEHFFEPKNVKTFTETPSMLEDFRRAMEERYDNKRGRRVDSSKDR